MMLVEFQRERADYWHGQYIRVRDESRLPETVYAFFMGFALAVLLFAR